jgi:UDP-N-acetyl-D-glucosamine dehydrogenase
VINNTFEEKKNLKVCIIGLGFVGLPIALLFHQKGFQVTGIDKDFKKVEKLKKGTSYNSDISDNEINLAISSGRFAVTSDYEVIQHQDIIIICVPTPLSSDHTPDLRFLEEVGKELVPQLKQHQLVVLESSTYPGTTTEFLQPILEKSNLKVGKDLFVAYSPERIDPGNTTYKIDEIAKVVSGVTMDCKEKIYKLYKEVYQNVVMVSSTEAAELTKLLENSYRFVNISFINEFAIQCEKLKIDAWEVIDAASTKPYGFQPFYPGPGIGGHCIPVDPLYLLWKLKENGMGSEFLQLSDELNKNVTDYIVNKIQDILPKRLSISKAKILIYGVTYKKDIDDARESPAINIIKSLRSLGASVSYHDPYVSTITEGDLSLQSIPLTNNYLQEADCVIILTNHSSLPVEQILNESKLVYDTRNVTKGFKGKAKVVRLGSGIDEKPNI